MTFNDEVIEGFRHVSITGLGASAGSYTYQLCDFEQVPKSPSPSTILLEETDFFLSYDNSNNSACTSKFTD